MTRNQLVSVSGLLSGYSMRWTRSDCSADRRSCRSASPTDEDENRRGTSRGFGGLLLSASSVDLGAKYGGPSARRAWMHLGLRLVVLSETDTRCASLLRIGLGGTLRDLSSIDRTQGELLRDADQIDRLLEMKPPLGQDVIESLQRVGDEIPLILEKSSEAGRIVGALRAYEGRRARSGALDRVFTDYVQAFVRAAANRGGEGSSAHGEQHDWPSVGPVASRSRGSSARQSSAHRSLGGRFGWRCPPLSAMTLRSRNSA